MPRQSASNLRQHKGSEKQLGGNALHFGPARLHLQLPKMRLPASFCLRRQIGTSDVENLAIAAA
jgi:hypothetical protein